MTMHSARQGLPFNLRRSLIGLLVYAGFLLLAFVLLRGQGANLARAQNAISQANLALLGLALGAELLRFGCMGLLLWALAAALGVRTPLLRAIRVMLIAVAARHLVPLGGIPDYALRARFLQRRGAPASTVAAYFLLNGVLSWLALISIFGLGFVGYVALNHGLPPQPGLFGGAALGSLGVLALLAWLWHGQRSAGHVLGWLHYLKLRAPAWLRKRLVSPERAMPFVDELRSSLRTVQSARGGPIALVALAMVPPLADVAALAAVFAALGLPVRLAAMLLGYGLAAYLAFLTPLPGDAGVVEAALTLVFTSLGYDLGLVAAGVLLFRLLSFWLPIPIGLLLWWGFEAEGVALAQPEPQA
ncbi:MAG: UPF0104 family protein [Chloroflexales bacterium]|nr:UPF0104 family protein [Chloroflexales bacterium]